MSVQVPKRIAIDFDNTISAGVFPACGPLKPGAREALSIFKMLGYDIIIWSCRTCHWDYDVYGGDRNQPTLERERVRDMIAFLDENDIPYDEVDDGSKGKPGADYYIDDKAIRFEDNWIDITARILADRQIKECETGLQQSLGTPMLGQKKEGKLIPFPTPKPGHQGDGPEVA